MVASQTNQRRQLLQRTFGSAAKANGVDYSSDLVIVPDCFAQSPSDLAHAFEPLPGEVEQPTHGIAMQELIPFPGRVAAHRGDRLLRLGERSADLIAQCIDFGAEIVDHHCDVMSDTCDLVFVLVGQKFPDLFDPGQRITDAG
ncbi:hypothetical protein C3473_07345 [Mycobacterium kansasii]|nr:hypothetical protein B1T50_14710 [Mycobacterium kansasii]POX81098.1 hypothetical protein C3470_15870 [Mycobacterium kansasii]POX95937.1 hypothetical protein C3473_07345 [Mycobacterium kansasii]POY12641.1 hypothetical protein C3474_06015 [Mycobacterium kansasii]